MDVLVRHRRRFAVDPAGARGWAAVLEHLGHRVHLGVDGRHAAVDSALHGRTLILRVTAPRTSPGPATAPADPQGAGDRLASLLAAMLRQSGATVWMEEQAADPCASRRAALTPEGREGLPLDEGIPADVLLHVALDDVTLRAWVATGGRPPWAAWRLGRHLARALWRAGCIPVGQRHRPTARTSRVLCRPPTPAEEAAAVAGGPSPGASPASTPRSSPVPGASAGHPGHGPADAPGTAASATARVLVPHLAATLRLPAGWPAEAVATALYQGLVTFFGGPADALVPGTIAASAPTGAEAPVAANATADGRPASAGQGRRQDPVAQDVAQGVPARSEADPAPCAARRAAQGAAGPDTPDPGSPGRSALAASDTEAARGSNPASPRPSDPGSKAAARDEADAPTQATDPAAPQRPGATAAAGVARRPAPAPVAAPADLPPAGMPPGAASGHVFVALRPTGAAAGRSAHPPGTRPSPSPSRPGPSVTVRPRTRSVPSFATGRPPGSLQPFR